METSISFLRYGWLETPPGMNLDKPMLSESLFGHAERRPKVRPSVKQSPSLLIVETSGLLG